MKVKWKGIYWQVFIYPLDNLVVLMPINSTLHERTEVELMRYNQMRGRGDLHEIKDEE